jgi:hypothetical protein
VPLTAQEVIRSYYRSLLAGRFNKTTLAEAMGTSRGQLNIVLKTGNLEMEHLDGIAAASDASVADAFLEIATIAKNMKRGRAAAATTVDLDEDQPLPGRRERPLLASESSSATLETSPSSESDAPSSPSPPRRKRRDRNHPRPR